MSVKIWLWGLVVSSILSVTKSALLQFRAFLRSEDGSIKGNITFTQLGYKVRIHGRVEGLGDGPHGLHVHQIGDTSEACTKTGEHYNPFNKTHGGLKGRNRHLGDLGNIRAFQGIATISVTIPERLVSLRAPYRILGRALALHEDPDDLGKGGRTDSLINGHTGEIEACGVIGVVSPVDSLMNLGSPAITKLSLKSLLLTFLPIIRFSC